MKTKFSKLDYLLFIFDDYRDRLTLIIVLNLFFLFLGSKLNDYFSTIYFETNFKDIFKFLSHQNELIHLYEALFYCYIIGFILQIVGSKLNKKWIFKLNGWFIFISTMYYWLNINESSFLDLISSKNYIFYFIIFLQLIFYLIFFYENFKKNINRTKINHS